MKYHVSLPLLISCLFTWAIQSMDRPAYQDFLDKITSIVDAAKDVLSARELEQFHKKNILLAKVKRRETARPQRDLLCDMIEFFKQGIEKLELIKQMKVKIASANSTSTVSGESHKSCLETNQEDSPAGALFDHDGKFKEQLTNFKKDRELSASVDAEKFALQQHIPISSALEPYTLIIKASDEYKQHEIIKEEYIALHKQVKSYIHTI